MKTIRGALAAALMMISGMSAQAAEYGFFKGPTWRTALIDFIKQFKPNPENVTGGITGDLGVHVYLVPGQFTGTYSLLHIERHPADRALGIFKALVDGGNAKIFGFIGNDVYILTWTKPVSAKTPGEGVSACLGDHDRADEAYDCQAQALAP
jgi:hypothetical protein